jgi:hypothetical protein
VNLDEFPLGSFEVDCDGSPCGSDVGRAGGWHHDDEPMWDEAAAAFGTGTPVQLARPERKVTIRYRYEDGHCKATSPQVTGFEATGADLQETRALVRQKLDAWLDPAVELDEVMPISQAGVTLVRGDRPALDGGEPGGRREPARLYNEMEDPDYDGPLDPTREGS